MTRHYFTRDEIDTIYQQHAGEPVFNGCTLVWLRQAYGNHVGHEANVGFYVDIPEARR